LEDRCIIAPIVGRNFKRAQKRNASDSPYISVITHSLGDSDSLDRSIRSVLEQDYPFFEHVLVHDAGADGAAEILQRYPHLRCATQGNASVGAAERAAAHGDVLVHLDPGDYFFWAAFSAVAAAFTSGAEIVVGKTRVVRKNTEWIHDPRIDLDSALRHWKTDAPPTRSVGWFLRRKALEAMNDEVAGGEPPDLALLLEATPRFKVEKVDHVLGVVHVTPDREASRRSAQLEYWREENFPLLNRMVEAMPAERSEPFQQARRLGYQRRRVWAVRQLKDQAREEYQLSGKLMMLPSRVSGGMVDAQQLVAEGDTVILIVADQQAGGKAIEESLLRRPRLPCPVVWIPRVSEDWVTETIRQGTRSDIEQAALSRAVCAFYFKHGTRLRWKIITAAPDPMELLVTLLAAAQSQGSETSTDKILAQMVPDGPALDRRFRREIEGTFDVDLCSVPFDHAAGYSVIRSGNREVLVYKPGGLRRCFASFMAAFLGIPDACLVEKERQGRRVGSQRGPSQLPDSALEAVYQSRYARHFYTDEELGAFRERWRKQGLAIGPASGPSPTLDGAEDGEDSDERWLLRQLDELDLTSFVKLNMSDPIFVVPPAQLAAFRAQYPDLTAITRDREIPQDREVVVFDLIDRSPPPAAQGASRRAISFRRELTPSILTGKKPGETPVPLADTRVRYVIFAVARTGSTYLCDLLRNQGFGNPKEHFRKPLAAVVRSAGAFGEVFHEVMRRDSMNGVFGTKIIAHRVFETFTDERDRATFFDWFRANGFKFVRLTRDPIDCAISAYFARETGVWHLSTPPAGDTQSRYESVDYDFEVISAWVDYFREEGERLDRLFARLQMEALQLAYAELARDPSGALGALARWVGLSEVNPELIGRPTHKKISDMVTKMTEFSARFRAEIGRGEDG
jgi:LPS sulfotransferase NodH